MIFSKILKNSFSADDQRVGSHHHSELRVADPAVPVPIHLRGNEPAKHEKRGQISFTQHYCLVQLETDSVTFFPAFEKLRLLTFLFDVTFAIICLMAACVMPGRWLSALIISPAGMQPGRSQYVEIFLSCISILDISDVSGYLDIICIGY